MKNIVNLKPNKIEETLCDIDANNYVEDQEIYGHFMDLFFDELKKYIQSNYKRKRGELRDEGKWYPPKGNEISVSEDADPKAIAFQNFCDNIKIYSKYIIDFDRQRQRFFEYEGKIYTYSITGDFGLTPIIVHEYEINDILENLEVYAHLINRSRFQQIIDAIFRLFGIRK